MEARKFISQSHRKRPQCHHRTSCGPDTGLRCKRATFMALTWDCQPYVRTPTVPPQGHYSYYHVGVIVWCRAQPAAPPPPRGPGYAPPKSNVRNRAMSALESARHAHHARSSLVIASPISRNFATLSGGPKSESLQICRKEGVPRSRALGSTLSTLQKLGQSLSPGAWARSYRSCGDHPARACIHIRALWKNGNLM